MTLATKTSLPNTDVGSTATHSGDVDCYRHVEVFAEVAERGNWNDFMGPLQRLKLIRKFTSQQFFPAWPRYWTWRMPVRRIRPQYREGCLVYLAKKEEVYHMTKTPGFKVNYCETIGQLFFVDATPV